MITRSGQRFNDHPKLQTTEIKSLIGHNEIEISWREILLILRSEYGMKSQFPETNLEVGAFDFLNC